MSDSNELINASNEMQWDGNIEHMLKSWEDQAKCFAWMHSEAQLEYARKAQKFMIFVTVLGSLSGLSNVIAGNYEIHGFQSSWIFGSLSIVLSMLTILQDKLGYQTLANDFKQYTLEWNVIIDNLREELTLDPRYRVNCATFLKMIRKARNKVDSEGSVKIPKHIRIKCLETFKNINDLDIPDICGQLEVSTVYNSRLAPTGSINHICINAPYQEGRGQPNENTHLLG